MYKLIIWHFDSVTWLLQQFWRYLRDGTELTYLMLVKICQQLLLSICQAYHSSLMVPDTRMVGNMALLPLKTQFKGPARGDGKAAELFWWPQSGADYSTT